ncbi:MAG: cohesin domain-containing protein [Ruminococcus flavefaciens]|nr:cohesin domain-containing protein [Ruminococcus flavefaciens]MCM1059171.1 cohesin domain-containing protein [Eubacterium sp.]
MRKFISAVTSLAMAATMASAVAPVVTSAAGKDTTKGLAIKTYAESDSKYASAGSNVTVSADDIAAGDVVIPVGIYLDEANPDTTSFNIMLSVNGGAAAKDITFNAYARTDSYFSTDKEYTLADGTSFTSKQVVLWAGAYNARGKKFVPHGQDQINAAQGLKAAETENYYYGFGWTNYGKEYTWTGTTSTDHPMSVFDVTLPKGLAAGEYTLDFLTYNSNQTAKDENGNLLYVPATMVQNGNTMTHLDGSLKLESMTINVEGSENPGPTTTTTSSSTTTTTTTTTTTNPGPTPDADVILDFGNWEAQPGDDVYVDVTVKSNGNAVISMDVRFKHDSPLELTAVEEFTPAYNDAAVMFNPANNGASFACPTPEGDAVVAEDGSVVFMLTYHVPENCPDGEYKIGIGDYFDIYKDNQSNMLKGATVNGIIKVGDGGSQTTTSSSTTTTTTTTTTSSSSSTTTTTTPGPTPSGEYTPTWGDVNCDGKVNVSDVVLLNKWLNDNKAYNMTDQGKVNADCCDPQDPTGGKVKVSGVKLTAADSDAIIRSIVHLVTLPVVNG